VRPHSPQCKHSSLTKYSMEKTIITCALTGTEDSPRLNPAVPVTPGELAAGNADLVKHAASTIKSIGGKVATSDQARSILVLQPR
jgi:uncharacterized protein (DUF849 family)